MPFRPINYNGSMIARRALLKMRAQAGIAAEAPAADQLTRQADD